MHQHAHLPEMAPFSFFFADSQGQLDSHFLFSCFYGRAGGEGGFVYKELLFLLSRHYACAMQQKDKLTTLNLSASCEEAPCSNKGSSPLRQESLLSPRVCCTVLGLNLQDQSHSFHTKRHV